MTALRSGTAGLVLACTLVSLGSAGPPGAGVKGKGGILVPPAIEAELKLDEGQREKVRKIESDFKQRRQGALMMTGLKMKGLFDRLDQNDAREAMPVLSIANEVTNTLLKMRGIRLEYEKKVLTVLNDEQKARYLAWLSRSPREKRGERKRGDRTELRGPLPDLDKELQLTPEQHRKLGEMEREWEARFRKVLTEEQRKRYDALTQGAGAKGKAPEKE